MDLILQWAWQAVSLFAGTFVHEDAAVLAGAYLVVSKGLPAGLAFGALVLGVIGGDILIYGIGRAARKARWLSRVTRKVESSRLGDLLDRRLIMAIAAARIMPTMAFPLFAACGVFRISFPRFVLASVATAVIYVAFVFALMLAFGRSLPSWATGYGWIGIAGLVLAVWLLRRWMSRSRDRARDVASTRKYLTVHKGMPALRSDKVRVAVQERINKYVFYAPLVAQWALLALRHGSVTVPTAANPRIEAGGLFGESKSDCMAMLQGPARRYLARTTDVPGIGGGGTPQQLFNQVQTAVSLVGIDYPFVVKPDIGWRGFGVRLVQNDDDLMDYVSQYPAGVRLIAQEYSPWHGEAAIFYVRRPGRATGEIFSMTFRYFPFVVGDGVSTLRDLILANNRMRWKRKELFSQHQHQLGWVPQDGEQVRLATVGSNRVGGLYVDAGSYITDELTARIDNLAKSMPEFHFGRFDVRFEDIANLQAGEGFAIVEINGAGSEAVHIWDPDVPLTEVFRVLFKQQALLFRIGAANRARGFRPMSIGALIGCGRRQNQLFSVYPPSS